MKDSEPVRAEIMDSWSFEELCERQRLDADFIVQCVEFSIVEEAGVGRKIPQPQWRFSALAVQRIEKARRLQRDLEISLSELSLVLDLLDEVSELRTEVTRLRRRLQHWEQLQTD